MTVWCFVFCLREYFPHTGTYLGLCSAIIADKQSEISCYHIGWHGHGLIWRSIPFSFTWKCSWFTIIWWHKVAYVTGTVNILYFITDVAKALWRKSEIYFRDLVLLELVVDSLVTFSLYNDLNVPSLWTDLISNLHHSGHDQ